MTALYQIVDQYRADVEKLNNLDLDEQTIADTLEAMGGKIEVKAQNVAQVYLQLRFMANAHKERSALIAARGSAIDHRADSILKYLSRCLEATSIKEIKTPDAVIYWRKSSSVAIDGEDMIPAKYMRTPPAPPPAPDKKAIADAIKAGEDVPGAHIEHKITLQIK